MIRRCVLAFAVATWLAGSLAAPSAGADGPTLNAPCSDPSRIASDATGTTLACLGTTWRAAPALAAGLHGVGSPCRQNGVQSTSPDSYLVVCQNEAWELDRR